MDSAKRKRRSTCKLVMGTLLWLLVAAVAIFVSRVISLAFSGMKNPHKAMQYEIKGKEVVDIEDVPLAERTSVVRPLIGAKQKYDIAANVWMREGEGDESDARIIINGKTYPERLIVSEKVFSGVTLKDKYVFANLTFLIPTRHFKQKNLTNYDLRASFVLIPNNPSLLDHAVNFTSWKTDEMGFPAMRRWNDHQPKLQDQIIDSFGVTIPLIEFHNAGRQCPNPYEFEDTYESDLDDDSGKINASIPFALELANEKGVAGYHPYIVTRTHLRVAEETRLYKRSVYNKAQRKLRNTLCKGPVWHHCGLRSFGTNGIWETKIKLQAPNEPQTKWAYAPFMSALPRSAGPRDLLAVPDNRESCPGLDAESESAKLTSDEQDHVVVTWRLSYSGRTPIKMNWADHRASKATKPYNMTEPDEVLDRLHYNHELQSGRYGHRFHEDSHPRRLQTIGLLSFSCFYLSLFLDIRYWHTRTSTVGISRVGTTLSAVADFSNFFVKWAMTLAISQTSGISLGPVQWVMVISFGPILWAAVLGFLKLKAVYRVEVDYQIRKDWFPKLFVTSSSHAERRSNRVEGQISWQVKSSIFLFVLVTMHLVEVDNYFLVQPRLPSIPSDLSKIHPFAKLGFLVGSACRHTGHIFQYLMNYYLGTFAGRYKLSVLVHLSERLLIIARYSPIIVGSTTGVDGIRMEMISSVVLLMIEFWQALVYRKVPQSGNEGEEE